MQNARYRRGCDGVVFDCIVIRPAGDRLLIRYMDGLRRTLAIVHPSLVS